MLRLVLFHTLKDDLAKGMSSVVISFADDKLFRVVRKRIDYKDIIRPSFWARNGQMKFCVDKCKVMGMGKNIPSFTVIGTESVLVDQQ